MKMKYGRKRGERKRERRKREMSVCWREDEQRRKKEGERGCRRSGMEKQREVDGGGPGGGGAEGEQV